MRERAHALLVAPEPLRLDRLSRLRPVLEEIGDLKRVRQGGRSVAEAGFADAWRALAAGEAADYVALCQVCRAVVAVVLGPIDAAALRASNVAPEDIVDIHADALLRRAEVMGPKITERLAGVLAGAVDAGPAEGLAPGFVARLAATPRAGPTFPGMRRLVLEPAENHAEHCWTVAVTGALIALLENRVAPNAPGDAFVAGLAHHLHNAWLPDGGYAGEAVLGERLEAIVDAGTRRGLAMLSPPLQGMVRRVLAGKDRVDTPAAAAFNAADAIDRVLQMAHFERANGFRLTHALDDLSLVHPGPLQDFQNRALRAAGVTA